MPPSDSRTGLAEWLPGFRAPPTTIVADVGLTVRLAVVATTVTVVELVAVSPATSVAAVR